MIAPALSADLACDATDVFELEAAAPHHIVVTEFEDAESAEVRLEGARTRVVEEEHRALALVQCGQARHLHRDAVYGAAFEVHDDLPVGPPLQRLLDLQDDAGDDDAVAPLVGPPRGLDVGGPSHNHPCGPVDPFFNADGTSVRCGLEMDRWSGG